MRGLLLAGALVPVFLGAGAPAAPVDRADPDVRVLTSGDDSELVKTIPIGRKRGAKPRVVMSIPGSQLGDLDPGMAIAASAELEVTTCLKANENHPGAEDKCTGKPYGFDPHVSARLVIASSAGGTSGVQIGGTDELKCNQSLPHRNHHCVLAIRWSREQIEAVRLNCPCALNLVANAWGGGAKRGHNLVIGSDSKGPVKGDKGRINAVTFADASERMPRPSETKQVVEKTVPIVPDGGPDPKLRVIYSLRIDNPREGDQFMVDARSITKIGSVNYNVELPTEVIVAKRRNTVSQGGVAVYTHPSSQVSELNGINCTQGKSAHPNPCLREKFGVFEISRDRSELFVNVVQGAEAKVTTQNHNSSDKGRFVGGGFLRVWRFD